MKSLSRVRVGILLGTAASALLLLPLSCGDDTTPAPLPDASGTGDSSNNRDTGPGMDGTMEARPDAPKEAAPDADATAETGGGADADAGMEADVVEDAPTDAPTDAPADVDAGPCGAPTDPTVARACVVISGTDQVNPVTLADGGATDLDNMGTLLIYAFAVPNPGDGGPDGGAATAIAQPIAYPPPDDAGLFSVEMPVSALTSLPPIPIDVPVTTAYLLTYFVDNKAGFQAIQQGTLTYGMYVGGLNLTQGIAPVPQLRPVTLVAGQGTLVPQYLTVMREFQTVVVRAPVLPDGGDLPPAAGGDGTGVLAVGAYRQAAPDPTRVYGGALTPCVDIIRAAPVPITGFFYTPTAGGSVWFGADLNDFGDQTTVPPAGSMVSIVLNDAGMQVVSDSQMVMVQANQYSVTIPYIALTATTPPPSSGVDFLKCPLLPPDAGSDAATDGPSDATGN